MSFRNQVILITGGSSGIGLATACQFAQEGARVWLLASNRERLALGLQEVEACAPSTDQVCGSVAADIADPDQVAAAVNRVIERAGLPDVVVNSAGVVRPGYFQDLDLAVFHDMMDVNYFGALHVIQAVAPGMMQRRSGHIVNISSGAAVLPTFGYSAYTASKYALRGLSDVLRLEMKPYGIHISVVYPPDVDTPQHAEEAPFRPPETNAAYPNAPISPELVARAILDGVRRRRYSIIPSREMSAAARAASILGDSQFTVLDRLIGKAWRKYHHESERK